MDQSKKTEANLNEIQQHFSSYKLQPGSIPMISVLTGSGSASYRELMHLYRMLSSLKAAMARDMAAIQSHLSMVERLEKGGRAEAVVMETLTTREVEVLEVFARGCSYKETADLLHCSLGTVQTHCKRIYRKLQVHSRSEAVFEASRLGQIQL